MISVTEITLLVHSTLPFRSEQTAAAMEIGWYHTGNHTPPCICTILTLNPLCNCYYCYIHYYIHTSIKSNDDYYEMKFQLAELKDCAEVAY